MERKRERTREVVVVTDGHDCVGVSGCGLFFWLIADYNQPPAPQLSAQKM